MRPPKLRVVQPIEAEPQNVSACHRVPRESELTWAPGSSKPGASARPPPSRPEKTSDRLASDRVIVRRVQTTRPGPVYPSASAPGRRALGSRATAGAADERCQAWRGRECSRNRACAGDHLNRAAAADVTVIHGACSAGPPEASQERSYSGSTKGHGRASGSPWCRRQRHEARRICSGSEAMTQNGSARC